MTLKINRLFLFISAMFWSSCSTGSAVLSNFVHNDEFECAPSIDPGSLTMVISNSYFSEITSADYASQAAFNEAISTAGAEHIRTVVLPDVSDLHTWSNGYEMQGGFHFFVLYPDVDPSLNEGDYEKYSCSILADLYERQANKHPSIEHVTYFAPSHITPP